MVRSVIVNNMLVGPDNMLISPDGWKRGQWLGQVMQNIETLYCPLGIIPKFIKIRIKGKSLIRSLDQGGSLSPDGWVKPKPEGSHSWGPVRCMAGYVCKS